MGWRVWGDTYDSTSSMQDTTLFQPVVMSSNIILRAVRTWIIYYDDPVYTSLSMKIYSNNNNSPGKLLHTSTDSRTQDEIREAGSIAGVREIYFNFNDVNLKGGDTYHFVINASGYSPTGDAHLAWMKGFPDPVYAGGYTPAGETLVVAPYQIYFIGSNL